jgi:hypothetical protein
MTTKAHPALKHGGYSGTSILPGEDAAAFEKLRRDLVDEFAPKGPLEEDIVMTITRLAWRKQNLSTYRKAAFAKDRAFSIKLEAIGALSTKREEVAELKAAAEFKVAAERKAAAELNVAAS